MKTFEKFEEVEGMEPCIKKPLVVHAKKMDEAFIVHTLEGRLEGKKGDYLIEGVEGELYPCDKNIFEKTYDWLENVGF